ncbi:MAG: DUF120 domain-containing protein [Thermoplasmata archaeon]|nr:MAG: DUF120 domain-containing protein [Thermoplasmata archaeon]
MKPYLIQVLKELALLGAINNRVEISSGELAAQIKTSQQTASRYLLELDEMGLIGRELGVKKQMIRITEEGANVLRDEYTQYQRIFELPEKIYLSGVVTSGMGEGRYYIEQKGYKIQFKEKLGFIPYPGTLNIEIKPVDRNKIRLLKKTDVIRINSFKSGDRTFGEVRCFPATINDVECVLVLPARGHYSTVLEFISPVSLREKLNLKDGDNINITVSLPREGERCYEE